MGMFSELRKLQKDDSQAAQKSRAAAGAPPAVEEKRGKEGSRERGKEVKKEIGKEGGLERGNQNSDFDINIRPYRKDSFLFTDEEFYAVGMLKMELNQKLDRKITKEDIARCAMHSVLEDYRKNGTNSELVRRLKKKQ